MSQPLYKGQVLCPKRANLSTKAKSYVPSVAFVERFESILSAFTAEIKLKWIGGGRGYN